MSDGIRSVWFWLPFHILQAYPMTRNLPFPDIFIPLSHWLWVPLYLAEHWTGLTPEVETAYGMISWGAPIQGLLSLAFFYFTAKLSDYKPVVYVAIASYYGFMVFAKKFGMVGSPTGKSYAELIESNADPQYNAHHTFLHIWYLTCMWVAAMTVPYEKLAKRGADTYSPIE